MANLLNNFKFLNPFTRSFAQNQKIEAEESKLDLSLIEEVVGAAKMRDIRSIGEDAEQQMECVEEVGVLPVDCIVLDIRPAEEQEQAPLLLPNVAVQHIPFFKLA